MKHITNEASGNDGILAELFKILKDDTVQVLNSMSANLENSAVARGLEKVSFIPISKKGNAKHVQTTVQLCSFHMLVRLCSRSCKLGFSGT